MNIETFQSIKTFEHKLLTTNYAIWRLLEHIPPQKLVTISAVCVALIYGLFREVGWVLRGAKGKNILDIHL